MIFLKVPLLWIKIPPGLLTLSVSLEPHVGHQMLEIASEMTQRQDTHKRQAPLWPEEKALHKQASWRFTFI